MCLEVSLRQRENLVEFPCCNLEIYIFFLRSDAFIFYCNFQICTLLQKSRKQLDNFFLAPSLRVADYTSKCWDVFKVDYLEHF